MESQNPSQFSQMLYSLSKRFRLLWSSVRCILHHRPRPRITIKRLGKLRTKKAEKNIQNSHLHNSSIQKPIRLATFNAALFSLAPAIRKPETGPLTNTNFPKGILKQQPSPLHQIINFPEKSKPKAVSINLPENEISLAQNKVTFNVVNDSSSTIFGTVNNNALAPMRSPICFPASMANWLNDANLYGSRTIFDVLKEMDVDVLALQDVKAEEENDMKPLSDLARALGMNYVFAESWAPEYGNAVLSRWPIKKWRVQKICDDKDFRNVIKATVDVPWAGELNVYCTQLDHLDESWRIKQINAMIQSNDQPHILAGGLNSLDASDYSLERWNDIVKYYEELGKPTPKVEVTNFLKGRQYTDAKDFPGECEPVVMIAKGQIKFQLISLSQSYFLFGPFYNKF